MELGEGGMRGIELVLPDRQRVEEGRGVGGHTISPALTIKTSRSLKASCILSSLAFVSNVIDCMIPSALSAYRALKK